MGKQQNPISKAARDNRANQLNPGHDVFWKSRGLILPPESPRPLSPSAESPPAGPQSDGKGGSQSGPTNNNQG